MRGCPKIISTLKLHRLQQTFAAFPNIAPCGLKITRVPRVGDIARAVRVIHQKADFVLGVFAKHAFQVAEIVAVVPDLFKNMPEAISILTSNGIVAGSVTAIVLNILFNMIGLKRQDPMHVE